jgi:hypothetical protein
MDNVIIPIIVLGDAVCDTHFSYTTDMINRIATEDSGERLGIDEIVEYYIDAIKSVHIEVAYPTRSKIINHVESFIHTAVLKHMCDHSVESKNMEDKIKSVKLLKRLLVCSNKNNEIYDDLLDHYFEDIAMHMERESKARVIQRRYRKAIVDPKYELCRRRLLREYEGLTGHGM